MNFSMSDSQRDWLNRLSSFMHKHVYPAEGTYKEQDAAGERWKVISVVQDLKRKARAEGLWNLFMPPSSHEDDEFRGAGLSNLEYAMLAEEMGRVYWASEVFNCSAPDTGNMEALIRYGSREQKRAWLRPLMDGEIRSTFLMTEPAVASSDATNIETSIKRDGEQYVINGRKWWSSGAGDPRCKIAIVMGKSDFTASKYEQQSTILVPLNTPGVKIERMLPVFGYDHAPHGHAEIHYDNVRVPASNMLLGEGKGFAIAQGRLGPGRIHHCMRLIGAAERALEELCKRIQNRSTFNKLLSQQGVIQEWVAESRIEIEQARLLTLKAAYMMDTVGNKKARKEIAMIKVMAPAMALKVIDRAIQAFGAAGVSEDTPLAALWANARTLRLADGPDEVHKAQLARLELKSYQEKEATYAHKGFV